jgi:hypothetical protein
MPQNLDRVTSFAPKNAQIAGVRVTPQPLVDLDRQAVLLPNHALPNKPAMGMAVTLPRFATHEACRTRDRTLALVVKYS